MDSAPTGGPAQSEALRFPRMRIPLNAELCSAPAVEGCPAGFSLLEMMMVVTLIMIVANFSVPVYRTCLALTREAVLRGDLFTMRKLIDQFTLDNGRSPANLEELVKAGYLGRLPTDPFTGSNQTWQEVKEDAPLPPEQTALGIMDVHSGSEEIALNGTPYSSW